MKRSGSFVTALGLILVGVAGPVFADFHPACSGMGAKSANVSLIANPDGSFTYAGTVNCPGPATSITVTELTLFRYDPAPDNPGRYTAAHTTTGSCNTSPCNVSATVSGPFPPNFYQVFMRFSVGGFNPTRRRTWLWLGTGQPSPVQ